MKRVVIFSMLLLPFCQLEAQTVRQSIWEEIRGNNPALKIANNALAISYSVSRTDNALDNPELEVGYQKNFADEGGKKMTLDISQDFDFSIISGRKKKVAKARYNAEEMEVLKKGFEVKAETYQLLDQIVYLKKKDGMYLQMVSINEQLVQLYEKSWKHGDCSKLEYNRARLALVDIQATHRTNLLELNSAYLQLVSANGGNALDTVGLGYDLRSLPSDFETWFSSIADALPIVQETTQRKKLCEAERKLAQSGWWPKLSAGYTSERTDEERFHGASLGVSLPLWENHYAVTSAKAKEKAAEQDAEIEKQMQHSAIYQLYIKAHSLAMMNTNYSETLPDILELKELMQKAVNAGEMSLTDYLSEMSTYYDLWGKLLDAEYQYQQAKTALLIYEQ